MKNDKSKDCSRELWEIFEKTGSIAAYLLYQDVKKKNTAKRTVKTKK